MSNPRDIYEVPFKVLRYMGLWVVETRNPKTKFYYSLYQGYTFFFLVFYLTFCFIDLYIYQHDVQKVSTNLTITISVTVLFWKNFMILQKYRRIESLKRFLRDGLLLRRDPEEDELLMNGIKEIRHACYLVYGMVAIVVTIWSFSPLVFPTKTHKFPMPIYIPWPHDDSPLFEIAYVYHVYCSFYTAVDILSVNLTFLVMVISICAEYNVLLKKTQDICRWYKGFSKDKGAKVFSEEENKTVEGMLVKIIHHHQQIVYAVIETENCYVQMMLVQFVGGGIVLTVLALNFILAFKTLDKRATTLIFMLTMIFVDLYLFCSLGSRVINKNDEFLNALYELPWEAMNNRNRKSVNIMMLRIKNPLRFTIQKIAPLNLSTILKITKGFYNLLYLLLHVAEKKNAINM